ncbi:MAG: hypothetical protein KGN78_08160 [Actinomycetales bacterium]|nr:hypothetical protein [Actinomycetales bacterium]
MKGVLRARAYSDSDAIGVHSPVIQPIDPLGLTPNVAALSADPEPRELTTVRSMAGVDAGAVPVDFGMGDSLVM